MRSQSHFIGHRTHDPFLSRNVKLASIYVCLVSVIDPIGHVQQRNDLVKSSPQVVNLRVEIVRYDNIAIAPEGAAVGVVGCYCCHDDRPCVLFD